MKYTSEDDIMIKTHPSILYSHAFTNPGFLQQEDSIRSLGIRSGNAQRGELYLCIGVSSSMNIHVGMGRPKRKEGPMPRQSRPPSGLSRALISELFRGYNIDIKENTYQAGMSTRDKVTEFQPRDMPLVDPT